MSLENTLREMLNETKMPESKGSERRLIAAQEVKERGMQEGILDTRLSKDAESAFLAGAVAAAAGVGMGVKVHQGALDRLDQAHVAQLDARHAATDAYHKLQQTADVNRKANTPAIAPGLKQTVTTKPRRRLEETIAEAISKRIWKPLGAAAAAAGAATLFTSGQLGTQIYKQKLQDLEPQIALHTLQRTAAGRGLMSPAAVGKEIRFGPRQRLSGFDFNMPMGPGVDGPAPGSPTTPTTKKSKSINPPFFKPRRRLEETIVEHYKQRLEEMRVDPPMLRAMRSGAAELKKQAMTKRIAAEREAEKARQAGMTDAERRAEHVERLRERDRRNFAASLAVNTAVHQQRSGGGS
jgi:hypothetical protein